MKYKIKLSGKDIDVLLECIITEILASKDMKKYMEARCMDYESATIFLNRALDLYCKLKVEKDKKIDNKFKKFVIKRWGKSEWEDIKNFVDMPQSRKKKWMKLFKAQDEGKILEYFDGKHWHECSITSENIHTDQCETWRVKKETYKHTKQKEAK